MEQIFKSKTTLFEGSSYLTSDQLFQQVSLIAQGFKESGIHSQSVCLLNMDTTLHTLKALLALLSLGAITALLNPKLPNHITKQLLEDLGPYTLIDQLPWSNKQHPYTPHDHNKICFLMATSGSTGHPKWVSSTINHWIKSALGTLELFNASCNQPWVLSLPLFHVSGLSIVIRAFLSHAPLIITQDLLWFPCARISMIPLQLQRLIKQNRHHSLLKASSILVGGAPIDEATYQRLKNYPLYITYGMTESCSQISCSKKSPSTLTVGQALKYRTMTLDTNSQILIQGESVCDFFWNKGELIPLKTADNFYPTKDHGLFNLQGDLIILGRQDERISINGEKIYPWQIEQELKAHFEFEQLIVTSIHEGIVVAFCTPIPSDEDQTILKKTLGSLFFPKLFLPLDTEQHTGKILLKDLKKTAQSKFAATPL